MAAQEHRQQSGPMAAIPAGNPHAAALAPPGGIERFMPWFLSAMLHLGVVLIAVFMGVVITSAPRAAATVGDSFNSPPPLRPEEPPLARNSFLDRIDSTREGPNNDGARGPLTNRPDRKFQAKGNPRLAMWQRPRTPDPRVIGVPADGPCPVVGPPGTPGGSFFEFGGGGGTDGTGIRTRARVGGYSDVVFVIDRSGSMLETFETLKANMLRSIAKMVEIQRFDMVMFSSGEPMESGPRHVVWADPTQKAQAARFLKDLVCAGQTDPLPAIHRAFSVLAERDQDRTKAILLLTDGAFPDNAKVEQLIAQLNAGKQVHVYTYIYGASPPDVQTEQIMKRIARDNHGLYKYVSPN